ncbi:MAG TPA: hypothetical protein VIY69_07645, partial [Candidatus Acidoferrales bacterium]
VAIPVIALGLPISDVVLAVVRRFLSAKPLFAGDARHVHHQLLRRGFSQRNAVLTLYAVTGAFGFLSLMLLEGRRTLGLVLTVTSIGIFVGLRQLRYHEFDELISAMRRVGRRRVLANHVAVRHGAELLQSCDSFEAICTVLQSTLEPIGFDAIRLQKIGPNGYPASLIFPLRYGGSGGLLFSWSKSKTTKAPWELKLELVSRTKNRWGYLSMIRTSTKEALPLDVNVLNDSFQTSLADALDRTCTRLDAMREKSGKAENEQSIKPSVAAVITAD